MLLFVGFYTAVLILLASSKSILISATNGAVAAENKLCSQIGLEVLKEGGSAVDAVIAATICCGCLNSFSSGISFFSLPPRSSLGIGGYGLVGKV